MEKGEIIGQAFDIVYKTFQEINRMKDDLGEVFSNIDASMKYKEEYSQSSNYLWLKPNHTIIYKRDTGEPDDESINEEEVFALIFLFFEYLDLKRVNLKEEPEIWGGFVNIINRKEKSRPWDISNLLKLSERKHFKEKELHIGGNVYNYYWINEEMIENKTKWEGRFVGYPLVEINNINDLEVKIAEKLFK